MNNNSNNRLSKLKLVKLGIETRQDFILFIRADCFICISEGFEIQARVIVHLNKKSIIASLNIIHSDILQKGEASLSENAWEHIGAKEGDFINISHLLPVPSIDYVRSKIYGNALSASQLYEIISDIVAGKYSNIHLSSFITACGNDNLSIKEIIYLTQAMVKTGKQLHWNDPIILDKHSVGGIPGNRTTPIVVAIVAAAGLIIPKTSSRAITSPAGTADTIETMTEVNLPLSKIQKVVAREGGCIVWGDALGLSPADDILIRVERVLDIDPMGQMIASVLSKKVAVGATHVLIDVPVGPTAKIRSESEFFKYQKYFSLVGDALDLNVITLRTNGNQPIGKGIGPALEAKDILAVLHNDKDAPIDLKNKAITLAAILLELGKKIPLQQATELAINLLERGTALKKFLAICEAQGGFKVPPTASFTHDVVANQNGFITEIDNRDLAKIAKLAGAPYEPAAGIEFFARLGTQVEKGQLLYRIHAESKGILNYACTNALSMPNIIKITPEKI
ncbi:MULTISPECIES: thymidine phosphorylase family protein [Legionella]|uniref:Putative thymidine phosphorylase n=1 Tax=Legionella resiliens TaxID=2905958 RepID=A0ABS8X3S8_9GAMM|nr:MULTISPECIES: thymidine phosphorylase family protein [unclassified Legionella]MCE0723223.1 thymidine phosphorylase family protein [Legionella sp. 9fVS26]MCE3532376.1 thymidine phosphorylase family protein [Legionella sp. 8cVS16]QLZ68516.1 thymidine phosphorylase [Legionella sp. PC1000]